MHFLFLTSLPLSILTHIIHPFKWGHKLFILRSLLHAQWLACWQLIPEKTTAHEWFSWSCFQDWHLFHHPCDGYTLRFQILRVMTSSAPRDLAGSCVMTHGFDHKFRSMAIMTWNELKVWTCSRKNRIQLKFNSSPSPAAIGTKKKSTVELHQTSPYAGLLDPSFTLIQELQISKTL